MPEVSVIIVVRNEEQYIIDCIRSVESQFEKGDEWELIIVDGESSDRTRALALEHLAEVEYSWHVLDNPKKTLAPGWNIGIRQARGKYIIRPDAHASLHEGYIKKGIEILKKDPQVSAVGGSLVTRSKTYWGNIIMIALSSRIGVGNSSFRTGARSAYTDTAVYAVYRKEVFDRVGMFDEQLVRHQDNDLHHRIRKVGGRFFMNAEMKADYYCRDSIGSLCRQMYNIGKYLPDIMLRGSLSLRHMAPIAFYSFILLLLLLGVFLGHAWLWTGLIMLGLYLAAIIMESLVKSIRLKRISMLWLAFMIPLIHLTYAAGTFVGLIRALWRRPVSGSKKANTAI